MALFDFLNKRKSADEKEREEEKAKSITNAGLAGAADEVVQRYGSANKEHFVAYSGQDNEAGKTLKKGLKSISKSKVNPDYKDTNIKQQAGFSAEVKHTARENAERIISGDKSRVTRTDDIGRVNDPLYDHVELDANGNVIAGSGSQMKFVGSSPEAAVDRLASKKFQKYLDADAIIDVPSDYYEGMKEVAQKKIDGLEEQVANQKKQGNSAVTQQKQAELEKYKKIKKNLRKSRVSNKEAIEGRKVSELSTAKDIANISLRAGWEQAKMGAAIAGGMSIVRNFVAVVKGDKDADEAALAVVKDTGTGAVVSYTTAFAGSALKGGMQNAKDTTIRTLAKTNLPAQIVTATIDVGKTMGKYFRGEIDGVECLTELGEKGTGSLSAAMFAALGQIALPIPVVGAMIGSMLGYALSSACYGQLVAALQEAKLAREERIRIEAECAEAIKMIREYRAEMEKMVSLYLQDHIAVFHNAFDGIKTALDIGDVDGFIGGANAITRKLGKKPQFETFSEFDALMQSGSAFRL